MSSQDPVRWGVLGAADIAIRAVIPAIRSVPNAELHAVATRRSPQSGVDLGAARWYSGDGAYEALLADPAVEAVYIPVPNHLHRDWTLRALEAGKHVLCEKPLGATPAEVMEMIATSEQQGLLLMEAFMYRYSPQQRRLQEGVAAGALGDLQLLQASFTVSLDDLDGNVRMLPEPGAGALFDVGVYPLNTARWMFGAMPTEAYASAIRRSVDGVDQVTHIMLRFPEGRSAVIDCALALPFRCHYDVVGTVASAHVERPYASPPFLAARRQLETTIRPRLDDVPATDVFPDDDLYQLEVDAFCRGVRGDRSGMYPLAESADDAQVLAACLQSIRSGAPVQITGHG